MHHCRMRDHASMPPVVSITHFEPELLEVVLVGLKHSMVATAACTTTVSTAAVVGSTTTCDRRMPLPFGLKLRRHHVVIRSAVFIHVIDVCSVLASAQPTKMVVFRNGLYSTMSYILLRSIITKGINYDNYSCDNLFRDMDAISTRLTNAWSIKCFRCI